MRWVHAEWGGAINEEQASFFTCITCVLEQHVNHPAHRQCDYPVMQRRRVCTNTYLNRIPISTSEKQSQRQ